MKITKNWFYKLSDFNNSDINIWKNLQISIFDDLNFFVWEKINRKISVDVWSNSKVNFFWIIYNQNDVEITFKQNEIWSDLKVRCLMVSNEINKLKSRIYSSINSSYSKSEIKIISVVWNNWFIDLDWIVEIDKGIEKVEWNLIEENIFLWDKWKVKGIPTLLVRSNDVKASHSCKMERISDEQLFYLRSRWIQKESALKIMLEAKIKNLFSWLEKNNKELFDEQILNILERIS